MNLVVLLGHTGEDVKIREFQGGGKVGNVNIATDESYRKKDTGEKVAKTSWHRLIIPKYLCDTFQKYVKKGAKISVQGKLETRQYEKDGVNHYVTEVLVEKFDFASSNGQTSQNGAGPTTSTANSEFTNEPDDLPF